MPFHLCKLLPPRPTFPADMTAEEAGLMQEQHAPGEFQDDQLLASTQWVSRENLRHA